jgi:predicted nucleic acid-binding protein
MYNVLLIKDTMVLIHLAKTTTLEESCNYFQEVIIPEKVKQEVIKEEHPETTIIKELISNNKIKVKTINNKDYYKRANELNIFRGEAEVVALAWEMSADAIATDDDNVRKKREIIKLRIIGTPAILLTLFQKKKIDKEKLQKAIRKMKEIGWFSSTIWDKIQIEVEKNE